MSILYLNKWKRILHLAIEFQLINVGRMREKGNSTVLFQQSLSSGRQCADDQDSDLVKSSVTNTSIPLPCPRWVFQKPPAEAYNCGWKSQRDHDCLIGLSF